MATDARLGMCEVCNVRSAKYKCPRCELRTCSLVCCKIHKKELVCNGERDKLTFKHMSKFTNMDLLSDYRLLEDITRSTEFYNRDPSKNFTRIRKELPLHLFRLRAAASRRGIRLNYLPQNFTRHKQNTTYLDWKEQVILWRIEWIFPQADNLKVVDARVHEDHRLSFALNKYLDPIVADPKLKESLMYYQAAGVRGVRLLLKAENVPRSSSRFFELDTSMSVKANLQGRTIVEFPVIHVVLKDHIYSYDIISTDGDELPVDQDSCMEELKQEQIPRKSFSVDNLDCQPNNYLFNGDSLNMDSEEGSSDDELRQVKRKKTNTCELNIPAYETLIRQGNVCDTGT